MQHSLDHLVSHVQKYGSKHRLLYTTSIMFFFWTIFDGILSYILPIKIVEEGFNKTEMGIIIATSSVAGAAFDFLMGKLIKNPNYRRIFLSMFILSLLFLILLHQASTVGIYILAMAVWGIYWDLCNFGNIDFVSRVIPKSENSSAFGMLGIFKALGSVMASLIAGLVVVEAGIDTPFTIALVMLGIAFAFYLLLIASGKKKMTEVEDFQPQNLWHELVIWQKISVQIMPLLILTLMIFVNDAFFWTIGPLMAEESAYLGELGGLFVVAYLLPPLFTGWFVGPLTKKFGKKKTALYSFMIGSAIMSFLSLPENPYVLLGVVLLASSFISLSFPALSGAYADYLSETKAYENEIQGVSDFFYNVGWAVGPLLGGVFADALGNQLSFSILGMMSVVITFVLIKLTPRKIRIKVSE